MSNRFDNRTVSTFKKDIYFSTMMEKYFFDKWRDVVKVTEGMVIDDWDNNGCGNDGEFIAKGNTAGADYKISASFEDCWSETIQLVDEPLEIKWVPTAGKFTLKEGDLKAYVKEGASILFIYNSVNCGTNMRKPKDYDLDKYKQLVESKGQQIRWGVMWSDMVERFYNNAKENNLFRPINYMGGKSGVVLKSSDFGKWFDEHSWEEVK
jgi:hypothetical protein